MKTSRCFRLLEWCKLSPVRWNRDEEQRKKETASTTVSFSYIQENTDLVFVVFLFHFLARDGA